MDHRLTTTDNDSSQDPLIPPNSTPPVSPKPPSHRSMSSSPPPRKTRKSWSSPPSTPKSNAGPKVIFRQTKTLIRKNMLLLFRKWITTALRAWLLPLGIVIFLCFAKNIFFPPQTFGIGDLAPVHKLKDVQNGKLVFIKGHLGDFADPFIEKVIVDEELDRKKVAVIEKEEDLSQICSINLQGSSQCYAAVSFHNPIQSLQSLWDGRQEKWLLERTDLSDLEYAYKILINPSLKTGMIDVIHQNSPIETHVLPLQLAVSRALAPSLPSSQPLQRAYTKTTASMSSTLVSQAYLRGIARYIYPAFFIAMMGAIYQLPGLFVGERENGTTSLLTAHGCTISARYFSWHITISVLYLPGWIATGILLAAKVFTVSTPEVIIAWQIIGGLSLVSYTLLISAFFRRSQLAAVVAATLSMMLATAPVGITFTQHRTFPGAVFAVASAIFPPVNYISFISTLATWEAGSDPIQLSKRLSDIGIDHHGGPASVPGAVYICLAVFHTLFLPILAAGIEYLTFGIKSKGVRIGLKEDNDDRGPGAGAKMGVRITGFTRRFGKGKKMVTAVDKLNLEVYKGQVCCLLGSNGSGKTTTLQAIAGIGGMSEGVVEIAGLGGRGAGTLSGVGVCPQGNVLWDYLTVEEHVKLWTEIKCTNPKSGEDANIIMECDLFKKRKAYSSALSGGQKRKLQLAIMLVGGVEVCCMDEVSSGVDPLSRQKLHEIILANRGKRTFIFTTHFLDEADRLSDQIAVIQKGVLLCSSTPAALKTQFGNGYRITAKDGKQWVVRDQYQVSSTIRKIEASGVEDYKVVGPTLEEVFLNVCNDRKPGIPNVESSDDLSSSSATFQPAPGDLQRTESKKLNLSNKGSPSFWREVTAMYGKRWMMIRRAFVPVVCTLVIPLAVAAATRMLVAGYRAGTCTPKETDIYQNLTRLGMGAKYRGKPIGLVSPNQQVMNNAAAQESFPVMLSLSKVAATTTAKVAATATWTPTAAVRTTTWDVETDVATATAVAGSGVWKRDVKEEVEKKVAPKAGFTTEDLQDLRVLLSPEKYWLSSPEIARARAISQGLAPDKAILFTTDLPTFQSALNTNFSDLPVAIHATPDGHDTIIGINVQMPMYYAAQPLNLLHNQYLNQTGKKMILNTIVEYLPHIESNEEGFGNSVVFVTFFLYSMALAAAFATLYPTFEKVRHVRALHYSNGVRPSALWLGHLLYESPWLMISGLLSVLVMATNVPSNWYSSSMLAVVFFLYGIAGTLLSFIVSIFSKSALAAFPMMAGLNAAVYTLFIVVYLVLYTVGSAETLVESTHGVFLALGLVFPQVCLARALMLSLNMFGLSCDGNRGLRQVAVDWDMYGGPIAFLLLQSLVMYGFLVWHESGRPLPAIFRTIISLLRGVRPSKRSRPISIAAPLISQSDSTTPALFVDHISKSFGTHRAVQDVTFSISHNETFCLLGPNGAGKTTTISMILGELKPSRGDIFVESHSIRSQQRLARASLGVCPQFDAIDNLTVHQTLTFYAKVKGVKDIARNVREIIRGVGLERFTERKSDALSGGNRRKLSLGIALMGNPAVLLLDEPSSGTDATAKRIMWKTLQSISTDRAILLTTHSMEECEALATRVGILGQRMLALGTMSDLKRSHGLYHHLTLVLRSAPHSSEEEVGKLKEWVEMNFKVKVEEGEGLMGLVRVRVPEEGWRGRELFRVLERGRREVGVREFSVAETGMEEVFCGIAGVYEMEGVRREVEAERRRKGEKLK